MKNFALRFLPVLVLCLGLAAGCATQKGATEDVSASTEVVPEETMTTEAPTNKDLADGTVKESPVETASLEDTDLARLAEEVRKLYTVHFDFDKYNIRSEDAELLKRNAKWLRANTGARIRIEGHADERGETEYNLALGDKRARSVKDFLISLGVDGSRLKIISYGEERPAIQGHNESAWSKNRRAEFRLAN